MILTDLWKNNTLFPYVAGESDGDSTESENTNQPHIIELWINTALEQDTQADTGNSVMCLKTSGFF